MAQERGHSARGVLHSLCVCVCVCVCVGVGALASSYRDSMCFVLICFRSFVQANKSYFIDDPDFSYAGSVSMLQEIIEHGAIKIITVNKGLVGVAFDEVRELHCGKTRMIDQQTDLLLVFFLLLLQGKLVRLVHLPRRCLRLLFNHHLQILSVSWNHLKPQSHLAGLIGALT